MSLFKLKSLWSRAFSEEEFDEKHLAVGKIGRQPAIAVGNFQGRLRVFLFSRNREVQARSIYDNQFENGIVDVKFVSHPDERIRHSTIGVLFFRKFAYITFEQAGEVFEPRLMYVEVEPSFGIGISPICVMTLNSTIQYLNPLEVQKIKVADPIYPFTRSLSKIYFVDGEELVEIQGSTQQWRIIVGRIRQLFVFMDTIVVIGQRALWEVSHAKIIKTKVMEEEISCGAIAFRNVSAYNIIVGNFSGQLFVYSSTYELLWAMKLDYVPLRVIVCEHQQIKGALVILSEEGHLQLAYSGVELPDTVIEPLSDKIDYAIVTAETEELMNKMKNKEDPGKQVNEMNNQKVGYRLYFNEMEKSYESMEEKDRLFQIQGKLVKCQLVCEVTSREPLKNFKVQISLPYNIFSSQTIKELSSAKSGDKVSFSLFTHNQSFPYQRDIPVIVRYQNNDQRGPPFIKMEDVAIPMALQCLVNGFESKESFQNKIIIKSNVELPSFNELFPELVAKGSPQYRKAFRFTLSNGIECIITYNKGFNKAKIESPQYSGLCYIITEFSNHVRQFNAKTKSKIELSVEIPLEQFFSIMKEHFQFRQKLRQAFKDVESKSEEFRNTQKKLLVKMKEKMNNLGNVDKMLEYTYERLIDSANNYEEISHEMDIVNHNLCVAIKLIIQLLFIRSNPSAKAKNIALGILGYEKESLERGWEEKVFANSSYFLNKKYNKNDHISFEQLQKIPLFVISKVNNGDWN